MQWYSHLYVGKKAKRHRYAIIQGIREEKLQPEVYVITSPCSLMVNFFSSLRRKSK